MGLRPSEQIATKVKGWRSAEDWSDDPIRIRVDLTIPRRLLAQMDDPWMDAAEAAWDAVYQMRPEARQKHRKAPSHLVRVPVVRTPSP